MKIKRNNPCKVPGTELVLSACAGVLVGGTSIAISIVGGPKGCQAGEPWQKGEEFLPGQG